MNSAVMSVSSGTIDYETVQLTADNVPGAQLDEPGAQLDESFDKHMYRGRTSSMAIVS